MWSEDCCLACDRGEHDACTVTFVMHGLDGPEKQNCRCYCRRRKNAEAVR